MGNTSYSQGEQLQLICSSEGGPQLEYTWTFSGGMITNATSNILTIDNVTTSNGGNYTCNVTNNAGYDTSTVTVYSELLLVTSVLLYVRTYVPIDKYERQTIGVPLISMLYLCH